MAPDHQARWQHRCLEVGCLELKRESWSWICEKGVGSASSSLQSNGILRTAIWGTHACSGCSNVDRQPRQWVGS